MVGQRGNGISVGAAKFLSLGYDPETESFTIGRRATTERGGILRHCAAAERD